jgi:hypothetical protein
MTPDQQLSEASERELQLLCIAAHSVVTLADKLDDIITLLQQQNDLLRALLRKERTP